MRLQSAVLLVATSSMTCDRDYFGVIVGSVDSRVLVLIQSLEIVGLSLQHLGCSIPTIPGVFLKINLLHQV